MQQQTQTNQAHRAHHNVEACVVDGERALLLPLPWDGDGLNLALDCGASYQIICHTSQQAQSIFDHLILCDGVAIVNQNGGLIGDLSVRENLRLPSAYHGNRSVLANLERDALELLSACDMSESAAQWMCAPPASLSQIDKRLVAYIRALLSRPEILVFDHVFEGLTRSEVDRVLNWRKVFHRNFPFRTLIFIDRDFHGLPQLSNCVSVAARADQ
jgi:ABC-type branched-subunit amino acid transport system ATPase component